MKKKGTTKKEKPVRKTGTTGVLIDTKKIERAELRKNIREALKAILG